MQVNIKGLISRLNDLTERLNKLFDKLEKLDDLDQEEMAIEDVEQYFQNDDTFNLSIALDILVQADKLDKVLDTIREKRVDCNVLIFYLKAHNETGHIDYAFDSYNDHAKDSEKPQLTKEEFDSLKEVLLCQQ